jgi:BioY family
MILRPKGTRMSQSKVLADQLYSGEGAAADLVRIAAANILLVLCAHLVIPLPFTPVPITGQTFGVLLVAVLFGPRRSALTLILYLLEGAAGLPVFLPLGLPGIARFVGPSAGYLIANRSQPSSPDGSWSAAQPSHCLAHLSPSPLARRWSVPCFAEKRLFFWGDARGSQSACI